MSIIFDPILRKFRKRDSSGGVTPADLAAEIAARISADNDLQDNIDAEAFTRANNDTTLQGNINSESSARSAADSAEATARSNADTVLQNNITAEESSRIAADSALSSRTTILENEELKIFYFATISATSGAITKPTGSTIILNDIQKGVDAVIETIINGEPSGLSAYTTAGVPVTVSSFDLSGNFVLSGTPSDFPGNVALLYVLKIKMIDYGNLTLDNIIEAQSNVDISTQAIGNLINGATSKSTPVDADSIGLSDSAASNILKKLTWANLKATLKIYFDTFYPSGSGTSTGTNTGDNAVNTRSDNRALLRQTYGGF